MMRNTVDFFRAGIPPVFSGPRGGRGADATSPVSGSAAHGTLRPEYA
ncbi:hypothetical protein BH20ACT10_BH20ACT10_07850 [soil metagenome]